MKPCQISYAHMRARTPIKARIEQKKKAPREYTPRGSKLARMAVWAYNGYLRALRASSIFFCPDLRKAP